VPGGRFACPAGEGHERRSSSRTLGPGLKRSLSVWQAAGLSLALMAPPIAANINPQGAIGAGRAVPLAFLIVSAGDACWYPDRGGRLAGRRG
jgi:hypothetical protein